VTGIFGTSERLKTAIDNDTLATTMAIMIVAHHAELSRLPLRVGSTVIVR
jgi:hypothetical protein